MDGKALTGQVIFLFHLDRHASPLSCHFIFELVVCVVMVQIIICKGVFGYERVYLPLCKVADTPFHIKGDDIYSQVHTFTFYDSS